MTGSGVGKPGGGYCNHTGYVRQESPVVKSQLEKSIDANWDATIDLINQFKERINELEQRLAKLEGRLNERG